MSSDWNDFLAGAHALGFDPIGYDGNGHIHLENPDTGRRYSATSTPSDHRSRKNDLADLERIVGRKLPRQRSGHYQHHKVPVSNFQKSFTELAASAEVDELLAEAEGLKTRFAELARTRGAVAEARELVQRYEDIRDLLGTHYYRVIGSIDAVELP
jgi:hypothetical protein